MAKLKLAISSCLIGNRVRYDGRDKLSVLHQSLIKLQIELVAICPEVGIGMSVPRPPIQLVKRDAGVRVKMVDDHSQDFTESLVDYAKGQSNLLATCDGYITAQRSPSCGFKSTNLFNQEQRLLSKQESGLFIAKIRKDFPEMPICDEEMLLEGDALNSFLERVKHYQNKKGFKKPFALRGQPIS